MPLTKWMAISVEAVFNALSLRVIQANLIACSADGGDLMPTRRQSQLQVNYVDGFVPQPYNPDKPGMLPSYKISFSNLGLNVGISVGLD